MESIDPYSPIHSPGWTILARHALRNRATCATVRISHRSTPCTTLGWNKRRWDPPKKDEHGIEEIHGHFTLQFPGRLCWWLYNVIECYTMLYIIAILGIWYFYIISSQDSLREQLVKHWMYHDISRFCAKEWSAAAQASTGGCGIGIHDHHQ